MAKLLIVDDEENVLYSFEKALKRPDLQVLTAGCGADAVRSVERNPPDAVVLDVRLPDQSGLDVFDQIRGIDPQIPVVIVTAHSTTETAIDAMKRGAFDYLLKPVDVHQLRTLVDKAVELSRLQHDSTRPGEIDELPPADGIVGRSTAMQEVYKTIGRVALEDVTVLVLGESGTGKELVARAIHNHSNRSDREFLAINCAALPETLLESELFGHERGAFTGADSRRIGKFEQADGGTLFLDEVGDMSPTTQAKLLRVLQNAVFERVGGNQSVQVDVRVIAATNQNLERQILSDQFRGDLLYRLNGFTICLPPLRDRMDDLPLLIDHFLQQFSRDSRRREPSLAAETMPFLENYRWPGNVRELQSVIQYAVVHATGDVITPDCLPDSCRDPHAQNGDVDATDDEEFAEIVESVRRRLRTDQPDLYRSLHAELDRVVLQEALNHVGGNQVHASEKLGISRTTLRAKLSQLGLADRTDERSGQASGPVRGRTS